jgi:hypothetical protein
MSAIALDTVILEGREIAPGSQVPDGPWIERLVRIGYVRVEADKPKRQPKAKES